MISCERALPPPSSLFNRIQRALLSFFLHLLNIVNTIVRALLITAAIQDFSSLYCILVDKIHVGIQFKGAMRMVMIVAMLVATVTGVAAANLKVGFYDKTCPQVESLVHGVVSSAVRKTKPIGAGLLRLHFHDCFVEGCDGSVLIDSTAGNQAEKDAPPNKGSLRGFETIDAAKAKVEAACPGIVSCADILAFAARDGVAQLGGPSYAVPAGRRDGTISRSADASSNLPSFTSGVSQLTQTFAAKKLTQDDMVTLSGAHTIGQAHCSSFSSRLYSFSTASFQDPSINASFAKSLKKICPQTASNTFFAQGLDTTPNTFDNTYYSNLVNGKGVLASDQVLFTDSRTRASVVANAQKDSTWTSKFSQAMVKMGAIDVKTGSLGEIRRNCRAFNTIKSTSSR